MDKNKESKEKKKQRLLLTNYNYYTIILKQLQYFLAK